MKIIKSMFGLALLSLVITSCNNELNFDTKRLVSDQQLEDLANSSPEASLLINIGVEDGQYAFMREFATNFEVTGSRHDDFGQKSIDLGMDLLSNDMVQVQDHWFGNYYAYRGRVQNFSTTKINFNYYYSIIRNVNSVIEQIPVDATDSALIHLRARALALRAFSYFGLIRVYQYTYQGNQGAAGVPLYAGDVNITSRATVQQVYDQILSDIDWAYNNITGYTRASKEKLNKAVIAGIYSRILLETGTDYNKCAQLASEAKASGSLMTNSSYVNDGFSLISNSEWMWGADINSETSTIYASFFSHVASGNPGYAGLLGIYKSIDAKLYDAIPATDIRKQNFADGNGSLPKYANTKFFDFTFFEGDYVYMRVAEMYLNEAEALARAGNDSQAQTVLFQLVSARDSGYTQSTNTGQDLINEILLQRRIELWGEGFAWFDMKRNKVDLNRDYPGTNHTAFGLFNFPYTDNQFLFQIPIEELDNNPDINVVDQNPL
ncbi:RagB/SusD family nutrient uptake outer membrane protein [Tenacibaculum xiamenense]|uniref:RagB/SusD family nutrient uptake outer membrane protein n=1 Tax=Tenacibaculum xiamenense TaxID=1261553 RepID=UPI0038959F98